MRNRPSSETQEAWEEYGVPLRRFIARRSKDPHETEDILQEVFLKAHVALAGERRPERLGPWLYRVAENAIADRFRERGRAALSLSSDPDEVVGNVDLPEDINVGPPSCLVPMIDELPEGYRRALVLADLENKRGREVAEKLGLSVPGAKSRVQRARRKLRAIFEACCTLEFDRVGNVLACERKEGTRCYRC